MFLCLRLNFVLFLSLFSSFFYPLYSQSLDFVEKLEVKEDYRIINQLEEELDWKRLLNLSLAASGAKELNSNFYKDRLALYISEFLQQNRDFSNDYEKSESVLRFLHGKLNQYNAYQTKLDILLEDGSYNCVSSTIMYIVMLRAVGIKAQGIGTFKHSFVSVALEDGRYIDVETTSRYGFDPGTKKEFHDTFTEQTGLIYVPKGAYKQRSILSDSALIALILQNRLYLLNKKQNSFDSEEKKLMKMLPLAVDLMTLSPTDLNRQNFFSLASQYIFNLSKTFGYKHALDLLRLLQRNFGDNAALISVRSTLAYNLIVAELRKSNFTKTWELLRKFNEDQVLLGAQYRTLKNNLEQNFGSSILNNQSLSFTEKLALIQNDKESSTPIFSAKKVQEFTHYLVNNEVILLMQQKKYSVAFKLLKPYTQVENLVKKYTNLQKNIHTIYINDISRQIFSLLRQENFSQAIKVIDEGLSLLPNNKILKDLQIEIQKRTSIP